MDSNKSGAAGGGIGFLGILAIVFIVLKLIGLINWSWWVVTSPLWLPSVIFLPVAAVMVSVWIIFKKRN